MRALLGRLLDSNFSPLVPFAILMDLPRFWELSMKCATPSARLRFVEMFDKYAASVVEQAKDRALNHIRTIEDYFPVRHDTIGTKPSFVLLHFSLDLPDRVFDNPAIVRLTNACIDMLILGNVCPNPFIFLSNDIRIIDFFLAGSLFI